MGSPIRVLCMVVCSRCSRLTIKKGVAGFFGRRFVSFGRPVLPYQPDNSCSLHTPVLRTLVILVHGILTQLIQVDLTKQSAPLPCLVTKSSLRKQWKIIGIIVVVLHRHYIVLGKCRSDTT